MYGLTVTIGWLSRAARICTLATLSVGLLGSGLSMAGTFNPPQNLSPAGDKVILDDSFVDEAWMVYTYNIDERGVVVDAKIHSSNGVPAVEKEVLKQVNSMIFNPATSNGRPVKVASDPVVFTWTLDKPREMSDRFAETYKAAQTFLTMESYDEAFDQLAKLKSYTGRSVYEEAKFQSLAATLVAHWDDQAAEMQHLNRVVELQSLADYERFDNPYVEPEEYALILERLLVLQLSRMMLADGAETLKKINRLGDESEIAVRASERFDSMAANYSTIPDVVIQGELLPMYRSGPGVWKTGLSRSVFSISDVKGTIETVYLSCNRGEIQLTFPSAQPWKVPRGWTDCKIDVSGRVGSHLMLHQLSAAR